MKFHLKSTVKFAVGTCVVLGVAAVAANDTILKVVGAGVNAGTQAMKEQWDNLHAEPVAKPYFSAEERKMFADVGEES